ncbi:hypothetical protein RYX36_027091 [Vicia faba]
MRCRGDLCHHKQKLKQRLGSKLVLKIIKDTDILAAFRVNPQPGVLAEDSGAAVATETSSGTWKTVWTDGLTSLDRYKGRCYEIELVPGEDNQFIAYVAYPLDLFEEGSVTNMFTSIVAIYKSQAETGEIKGHYLNATVGTCEEMLKRVVFARKLGVPIVMHDYLTGGFTPNTTLSHYCRDNGLVLHIHRATHAVIDRQKNHGMHFRVLAKALRMSGGYHIHVGTIVGKLEGEREITLGFVDLLRDDYIEKDRSCANRVALEACVQARNEGRDLAREGNAIIREACKWSPELAAACEVWKEIKFEFPAMDTL